MAKSRMLKIRVSDAEQRQVAERAKVAGFDSVSEFARHELLHPERSKAFEMLYEVLRLVRQRDPDLTNDMLPLYRRAVDALTQEVAE